MPKARGHHGAWQKLTWPSRAAASWRPSVALSYAMTLDGKLAAAAGAEPAAFSSRADRRRLHALRAWADCIVVGAQTLRQANPPMHVSDGMMGVVRQKRGQSPQPMVVVLSRTGRLQTNLKVFMGPCPVAVAVPQDSPISRAQAHMFRRAGAKVFRPKGASGTEVDGQNLLRALKKAGVQRVLLEGGGEAAWTFVRHGFIDHVFLTLCPRLVGGKHAPTPVDGLGLSLMSHPRFVLRDSAALGDEIFCHYAATSDSTR